MLRYVMHRYVPVMHRCQMQRYLLHKLSTLKTHGSINSTLKSSHSLICFSIINSSSFNPVICVHIVACTVQMDQVLWLRDGTLVALAEKIAAVYKCRVRASLNVVFPCGEHFRIFEPCAFSLWDW